MLNNTTLIQDKSTVIKKSIWKDIWKEKIYYIYLLPTFVLLIVFSYYPAFDAIRNSFFEWSAQGVRYYVGLGNFKSMVKDTILIASIKNLIILLIFGIIIGLSVPIIVAELIFNIRNEKLKFWYRWLIVVPIIVPGMVVLLLWQFIYDPNVGLLNGILKVIGLVSWQRTWLNDPDIALYCLIFIGFPWISGTNTLIILAGLNNIGRDIIDSSLIDGVTGFRRIWYIDLPLILGQIKVLLILGLIGGIQGFGSQLILTRGGPGYSTMVPGLHMYQQAFLYNRLGYACAIGLSMFIVILILTYINMRYLRSSIEYEAK
jgi:ABC-type sugar transport system permease subunit